MKATDQTTSLDIEQIELKSFSRSIAEIEWLMLILSVLYYVSPDAVVSEPVAVITAMLIFFTFVICFHYVNYSTKQSRWKLAVETWVMIAFISCMIWHTGKLDSPLLNLYLLVIIASAISLGKMVTLLEFLLISAFYLFLAASTGGANNFTLADFSYYMSIFAPFLIIAYIASMLAADVQYGKQMFKELSEADDLTGLLNKRSFYSMLEKTSKIASRYSHPFSLIMVDADNLKRINDQHGHKAGDKLILSLASVIKECLRESDIVARIGGDEFIVLLPEARAERAYEVAQRIRTSVENTSIDAQGVRLSSTVSLGIASFPNDAMEIEELLGKADSALYKSKKDGRNQVRHYSYNHNFEEEIRNEAA